MPKKKTTPNPESADSLAFVLEGFDYRIDCDEFLLYELGRLIEEEQASFEDEGFRRLIDEGIHEHVDMRLEIRAEIAMHLRSAMPRMDDGLRPIAARVLCAIEDTDFPLRDVGLILRTYTAYLFRKIEECAGQSTAREDEARTWIERWQNGEVLREEMTKHVKLIGRPAVGPLADLLFDSLEDRTIVETALDTLAAIRTSVSARILAHVVSEPMIDEDLEMKAYGLVRAMWPLPRHYILYWLRPHTHEDLPFRWFQLLIDCKDPAAVDRILEEVLAHGENPEFREDLLTLMELLGRARDADLEEKIMMALNTADTPRPAVRMLEAFLQTHPPVAAVSARPAGPKPALQSINKRYLAAAKLYDAGRKADALRKLNELLKEEPRYPLALMLKRLI